MHHGAVNTNCIVDSRVRGLTEALGWSAMVIGLWLALIGWGLAKGTLRGLR